MSIYTPLNVKLYNQQSFSMLDDNLKQNRDFVKACISKNGLLYECLLPEFKSDKEIIMLAFMQDQDVINLIPNEYQDDLNFILEMVRIHPLVIDQLKSSFKNNKTIILTAIADIGVDALWDKEIEIYQDVEIMVAALKSPYGQICWEPVLTAAGNVAEFSKIVIELAYSIYGEEVIEYDFNKIKFIPKVKELLLEKNSGYEKYFQN
jgi:hypothetical protein